MYERTRLRFSPAVCQQKLRRLSYRRLVETNMAMRRNDEPVSTHDQQSTFLSTSVDAKLKAAIAVIEQQSSIDVGIELISRWNDLTVADELMKRPYLAWDFVSEMRRSPRADHDVRTHTDRISPETRSRSTQPALARPERPSHAMSACGSSKKELMDWRAHWRSDGRGRLSLMFRLMIRNLSSTHEMLITVVDVINPS